MALPSAEELFFAAYLMYINSGVKGSMIKINKNSENCNVPLKKVKHISKMHVRVVYFFILKNIFRYHIYIYTYV